MTVSVLDMLFGRLVLLSHLCDYIQEAPKMRVMSSGEEAGLGGGEEGRGRGLVMGADVEEMKAQPGSEGRGYNCFQNCQKAPTPL